MLSSASVASSRSREETPGERVRKARVRKSLTQQELADLAGVHVNTIANLEDGTTRERPTKRGFATVEKVAAALGTTPQNLGYRKRQTNARARLSEMSAEQRAIVEEILGLPSDGLEKVREALAAIERRRKS